MILWLSFSCQQQLSKVCSLWRSDQKSWVGISTLPRERREGRREALYIDHWRSLSYIPTTPTDPCSDIHECTHMKTDTLIETQTQKHMHVHNAFSEADSDFAGKQSNVVELQSEWH